MDEQIEKLIVALMVLLAEKGGECKIDADAFRVMFEQRHSKGIQVHELGKDGILLKMGHMPMSPDQAMLN
jgi:hypothetical protein